MGNPLSLYTSASCAMTHRWRDGVATRDRDKLAYLLAYLKDSNAEAHSVDSDIFQSSDFSICALQDVTLTFIS